MLIAPTKLRGDLLTFAELGGDVRALFNDLDVSFEQVLAQAAIEASVIGRLYDRLAAEAPDDFALTCGRSIRLQYLGLLGYRLSNCATVGALLADWAELSVHIGYPLHTTFERFSDGWRMLFRVRFPLTARAERFCVVSTLAGFGQSVFNLSGRRIQLRRMGLPRPSSISGGGYDALEANELVYGCAVGFLEGATDDLDLPIATADAGLLRLCDDLCRQAWQGSADASLPARLAALFAERGALDLATASGALGISVRSMQRRLAAENTSYHLLLDEYRHGRAVHLVRAGGRLKTAAHELGFEDESSFRRSFKRWTGVSPRRWRELDRTDALPSRGQA